MKSDIVYDLYLDFANMIEIYTDGSCIGNPGPGGWGAIILGGSKKHILKGGEAATTNNRMEMEGVIAALNWLQIHGGKEKAKIHSDSNLIIQTMTQGWKKKANVDLWESIDKKIKGLNVEWKWVKAHAHNKYNNEVDKIALSEAKKSKRKN